MRAAGLGGLAALVGVAAGRTRTVRRRPDSVYDGDITAVWGLQPSDEVLDLNIAGDGRIAVRVGPADADFVAVFVPGTGADLGDTAENMARARSIHEASLRHADNATVAVIYALPFDAPDRILTNPLSADCACHPQKARVGGAALTEFVRALDLGDSRVTVIGHSYGSTVVGAAFAHEDLGAYADTPVFLGSPGVLVNQAADLKAPGAVYAAQASFDLIDLAGVWPILSAVTLGSVGRDHLIHGLDPTAPAFGARRVPTGGIGHGSYFTDGKTLDGIGKIVVGRGG